MAFKDNFLVKIFGGQKCLTVSDSFGLMGTHKREQSRGVLGKFQI